MRAPLAPQAKTVFESFEPRVLLSGDAIAPPRIDGELLSPGETDRYTFNLPEDLRVVFDSLTDNGNLRWSLDGPRGNVVTARSFQQSDSADLGGNVAYDLPAGDYMLTVDGAADTTGAYGFRLIDISQATDLTLGEVTTGELSPAAETDAYKFSVVAGQRFFIDRLSHTNDVYWRLLDPYGRTVNGPTWMGSDLGEMTLGLTGSYTLLVEGRRSAAGTAAYSFSVTLMDDAAPAPMTLGEVVAGALGTAGARQPYTFSLDAARQVLFDSLTENYYLSLVAGAGRRHGGREPALPRVRLVGGRSDNPALMLPAGDYRLTVDGEGDATGSLPLPPARPRGLHTLHAGRVDRRRSSGSSASCCPTRGSTAARRSRCCPGRSTARSC